MSKAIPGIIPSPIAASSSPIETADMTYNRLLERARVHKLLNDDIKALIEYSMLVPIDSRGNHYFSYREDLRYDDVENYSLTTLYFNPEKLLGRKR